MIHNWINNYYTGVRNTTKSPLPRPDLRLKQTFHEQSEKAERERVI